MKKSYAEIFISETVESDCVTEEWKKTEAEIKEETEGGKMDESD